MPSESEEIKYQSETCQTSPIKRPQIKIDHSLKDKYEDLLSNISDLKKQNVTKAQEIQRLKLNLYSKNLGKSCFMNFIKLSTI